MLDLESSPIRYHQICRSNQSLLCFRDDVYLCICGGDRTRVECFLYDDQLDRCFRCLANGVCLQGNSRQPNDFLCLCPVCHEGRQCQFNTESFVFTLDQLLYTDLSSDRRRTTLSLLIFVSVLLFFLALPNNLFSFITLRRRPCLLHGVGHYLLWMSVINQINLALFVARLVHLIVKISDISPSLIWDDLLCKSLNYLLSSSTRMVYWLTSIVSIERLCTSIFFNSHWLKKPRAARRGILITICGVFISDIYELLFYKSFASQADGQGSICVLQISHSDRTLWMTFHLLFLILNSLLPFLISLCCTVTVMSIVIKSKMNIRGAKECEFILFIKIQLKTILLLFSVDNSIVNGRRTVFQSVLHENRELITRPAIILVPSIFSLFSLAFFIASFSLGCQSLEKNPLRYLLITFYFITFIPQTAMFFLYIYPSSFYWKEWQATTINQRITALRPHTSSEAVITISTTEEHKMKNLPSETVKR